MVTEKSDSVNTLNSITKNTVKGVSKRADYIKIK